MLPPAKNLRTLSKLGYLGSYKPRRFTPDFSPLTLATAHDKINWSGLIESASIEAEKLAASAVSMKLHRDEGAMNLYFNAAALPEPATEYVAWIDVMGMQAWMSRSLHVSANFMCKLHVAVLRHAIDNVKVYPIMDGFYATSPTKADIERFLQFVLGDVADEFIETQEHRHRFIIKGAVAFGPVVHGSDISADASREIACNTQYGQTLLLGMPMVQANSSERFAPAFGIYVHESARSFCPTGEQPFRTIWWNWEREDSRRWSRLKSALREYYDWCSERAGSIGYEPERIDMHRRMMEQYFVEACMEE